VCGVGEQGGRRYSVELFLPARNHAKPEIAQSLTWCPEDDYNNELERYRARFCIYEIICL